MSYMLNSKDELAVTRQTCSFSPLYLCFDTISKYQILTQKLIKSANDTWSDQQYYTY